MSRTKRRVNLEKVYRYIASSVTAGNPPSVRDIVANTDVSSTSHAHFLLKKLEAQGRIIRTPGVHRSITLPD